MERFKTTIKRILFTMVLGTALGIIGAFFFAPSAIEWYANPAVPTVCSCAEQIQWALTKMRTSLEVIGFVGAVVSVASVELLRRFRRDRSKRSNGGCGLGSMSSPEAERLVALYEGLDPQARASVRRALLLRAGQDEIDRHLHEVVTAQKRFDEPPPADRHEFQPLSDQLIRWFRDVRKAVSAYVPKDRYKPGDESTLDLIRPETLHAMEPLEWVLKSYFRYEVKGLEHVPRRGRAMIVSNHGLLPVDGWFLSYEIMRATGRWVRGLTDWRIYQIPALRQFFMDMGTVVGTPENGDALLRKEELIFIMPGGSKEAWKASKYRYRLLWQGRLGFIKLALRNRCPIIPSANVGTDDTYWVLFDGYTTAYKLFRTKKALLPISLPIGLGPFPLPARMTQYVGEPILLPYPPEAERDPAIVQECQEIVKTKVYELIDIGLREREERSLRKL